MAHSRRMGFMKCEQRFSILRNLQLHAAAKKFSGLKTITIGDALDLPLVSLSNQLNDKSTSIKKTCNGTPVLQAFFDSYQSTAVAPDHLLSRLSADVLSCCFEFIPCKNKR